MSDEPQIRTFLIADVRGYTAFTVERGDMAAAQLASRFAALTQECVSAFDGHVVELRGDEALAVFASARQALRAAVELQSRFARCLEEDPDLPLHVGIGLDAGEAVPVGDGYRGAALNLAARLCSAAHAGESLASDTVVNLARRIDGVHYVDRGSLLFKGFTDPIRVVEVRAQAPVGSKDYKREETQDISENRHSRQELPVGGYLGALPTSPLIARAAEVAALSASIDAAAQATGRVVLLAGEPGAGKTRLAQEMTKQAHAQGFIVAAGRCYEPQQSVPFYPFLEAITAAYAAAPKDLQSGLLTRWPGLAQLLPALGLPQEDYASPHNQQRLFWAVTGFFQALSEESPLAILLDDLHWADVASVDLVQHLARHTARNRVLLLGTYRDIELQRHHPLHALVRDLDREGIVIKLTVSRLAPEGTAALIAATTGDDTPAPELVQLVHDRTEGNPFFVQQVMRMLVERGIVFDGKESWSQKRVDEMDVPDTIRLVIGQRLANLLPETQEILHEASVLGQTFLFEDLEGTSQRGERAIEDGLEEAMAVGLIREAGRDRYGFDHALTQQALYHQLSSRRQRRLHLAAAEAIEHLARDGGRSRAAELSWHFVQGDAPERALAYAIVAGDEAEAVFAHEDAALHFHTALELAQRLRVDEAEAQIRERIGGLFTAVVRYDDALPMLERAATIYRTTGDQEAEARVIAQMGRVYVAGMSADRQLESGIELVRRTLVSLESSGSPSARASLNSSLGRLLYVAGHYGEALGSANRASELAQESGSGGLEAEAEVTAGASLPLLGRWPEGLQRLRRAVEMAEQVDDVFSTCRGLQHLSMVFLARGDLTESAESMKRALALAERMSNRRQIATTLFGLALIDSVTGDPIHSAQYAERAYHHMTGVGGSWFRLLLQAGASLMHSHEEWSAMPEALRKCVELSEGSEDRQELRRRRMAAELALASGNPVEALSLLQAIRDHLRFESEQQLGLIPLEARVLLATYRVEEARTDVMRALAHVEVSALRLFQPDLLCVLAQIQATEGDEEAATRTIRDAVEIAASMPYVWSEIRARRASQTLFHNSHDKGGHEEQQTRVDLLLAQVHGSVPGLHG